MSGGSVVESPPANVGDKGWIPGLGGFQCHGAAKPALRKYWAHVLQLLKPKNLAPVLHNTGDHHVERPVHRQQGEPPTP